MKHSSAAAVVGAWRWMALFIVTFCVTLFFQMRGIQGAGPRRQPAVSLVSSAHEAGVPEAASAPAPSLAAGIFRESAVQARPEEEPARYAMFIESALIDDDSQARAVAIRELAQAPPEQAIATLEQVLRTDSDPENRALALQELLQMPAHDAAGPARAQLLQEFADDADGRVAALAREGLQQASL